MDKPERGTLVVIEADGRRWWADLAGVERWVRIQVTIRETMFRIDGRWVLRIDDWVELGYGATPAPGRLVSSLDAANWFIGNGLELPKDLVRHAEAWRLPAPASETSRTSTRRRKRRHRHARRSDRHDADDGDRDEQPPG